MSPAQKQHNENCMRKASQLVRECSLRQGKQTPTEQFVELLRRLIRKVSSLTTLESKPGCPTYGPGPPWSARQISWFARRRHLRLVFENDDELLDLAPLLLDGESFGLLNPLMVLKFLRCLQRLACLFVSLP